MILTASCLIILPTVIRYRHAEAVVVVIMRGTKRGPTGPGSFHAFEML